MSDAARNPARYRKMLEPHADADTANEALGKFFAAVEKAREEFRIPEVIVLTEIIMGERELRARSSLALGSFVNKLPILARAYGAAREEHEQMLHNIIDDARKQERTK